MVDMLKCEDCHQRVNEIIIMRNGKRFCFHCVKTKFWTYLREGGYWRKLFNKPAYNAEFVPNKRGGRH